MAIDENMLIADALSEVIKQKQDMPDDVVTEVASNSDDNTTAVSENNPADNIEAVEHPALKGGVKTKAELPGANHLRRISEADRIKAFGYNGYKPESIEEREERERLERNQKAISAIGDGLSAFANLYYTTRYAPNMINAGDETMTERTLKRHNEIKKDREAREEAYRKAYERAKERDEEYERTEREWLYKKQKAELERKLAEEKNRREEEKAERQAAIDNARLAWMNGRLTYQQYQNEVARIRVGNVYAGGTTTGSKRGKSRSGKGSGKSSSKGSGVYPYYDRYGYLNYADTADDAKKRAKEEGTWQEATTRSVSETTSDGKRITETQRTPAQSVKPENPQVKPINKSNGKGKKDKYKNLSKLKLK